MSDKNIPGPDGAYEAFFRKVNEYVAAKCTAKVWSHIPQAAETELDASYFEWHTAYEITLKPCTPTDTAEKNRIRRASEKHLRDFINIYLRFHPDVTEEDKRNMGIHIPDPIRTTIEPPKTVPELEPHAGNPRQVEVPYHDAGSERRGKPENVHGIEILWAVLDHEPTGVEELIHSAFDTRSPLTLTFDESDRGKRVYMAGRWEIEREGEKGPTGEIVSCFIP
jgi:hypothetical protein